MALVWSKNASVVFWVCVRPCPPQREKEMSQDFRESTTKTSCPSPIILVSYKHEISANTFERGVRNETGARLLPTLSIDGVAVNVKSEGEGVKKQVSKGTTRRVATMFLQLPRSQIESQLPKVSSPTSSQSKMSQFPHHQKQSSQKPVFFHQKAVLRLPSKNRKSNVFFRQPSSKAKQQRWPPWDLRLFSKNGQLFHSTSVQGRKSSYHQRVYFKHVTLGVSSSRLPRVFSFLAINFAWV